MIESTQEIREVLRRAGDAPDDGIDLAGTALALAALDRPRVPLDRYRAHLDELAQEVAGTGAGRQPGAESAAWALRTVLSDKFGYQGDQQTYEDLQNANLMRVIDRRKGLPVALGILYIHAGRAQGWSVAGLNFPGHFLIRLERDGERAILDPFDGGRPRGVAELRGLLKAIAGADAELTPEHYEAVTDRSILLRLQNNLKLRHLRGQSVDDAVRVLDGMLLIAPHEAMLWREAGLLHARLGNLGAAIRSLESFMSHSDDDRARHQAAALLQQLKARLN
ncbi:MAG TPA: transglutaminase-like domain-containing protein [Alphaproteobacteria bacterium]|nr:transglutaminase-like domain-containing protein [Alphaproteobacteria bacterium]